MQPFVRDEIFHVNLALIGHDLRQARRAVLVANLAELFFDDREDALLFGQNVAKIFDRFEKFLVFLIDLLALEPGELIQAKIKDFVSLLFAEGVAAICQAGLAANQDADLLDLPPGEFEGQQFYSRFIATGRTANDADEIRPDSPARSDNLRAFRRAPPLCATRSACGAGRLRAGARCSRRSLP